MRQLLPSLFLPLILSLSILPAHADETAMERQCLERVHGASAVLRDCLNRVADACQMEEENRNALGAIHCFDRETKVWDAILNARYKELRKAMKPEEAEELRAMQRAWIAARDTECDLTARFFARYSGSAGAQAGAACRRDRTAERAALLDEWAMRIADF